MKRIVNLVLLPLLIFLSTLPQTWADMRLEILDLSQRLVRITYEINDSKPGNRVFLFPSDGFIYDTTTGIFQVESVFDLTAKQEMQYFIVNNELSNLPQVKITYPEPIRRDQSKSIQIAVKLTLPESLLQRDLNGRYVFQYETSHKFEFLIPQGHYLIYSNQPVLIFEKGEQLIAQQLDTKFRKIILQTRPMQ